MLGGDECGLDRPRRRLAAGRGGTTLRAIRASIGVPPTTGRVPPRLASTGLAPTRLAHAGMANIGRACRDIFSPDTYNSAFVRPGTGRAG